MRAPAPNKWGTNEPKLKRERVIRVGSRRLPHSNAPRRSCEMQQTLRAAAELALPLLSLSALVKNVKNRVRGAARPS